TVTVPTQGSMRFEDAEAGTGTLGYGGVEWMRAAGGVWHGKELSPSDVPRVQGFQLWIALPPGLENAQPESRYIEAEAMPPGELALFDDSEAPIALRNAGEADAVFVLGSAVPHPHELHLGNYSVHTSPRALAAGEQRIAELYRKMQAAGDRGTGSGTVPVYR